jgi:hypothetical protein
LAKKAVHVVPSGGKWVVKKEGAAAATSSHRTQSTAWKKGQSVAKSEKTEAYLHGRDGRIRERNTYGHDPRKSKG